MSERWRVGRHFPIHIYEGEDIPVATALTVAYAKQIVADHNAIVTTFPSQPDALKLAEADEAPMKGATDADAIEWLENQADWHNMQESAADATGWVESIPYHKARRMIFSDAAKALAAIRAIPKGE